MLLVLALAAARPVHLAACDRYAVPPTAAESISDAALVTRAAQKATGPHDLGTVMATDGWRVIWATPADSESGVFFFRGSPGAERYVDAWGGTPDRASVMTFERKMGVPAAFGRCVADRLLKDDVLSGRGTH